MNQSSRLYQYLQQQQAGFYPVVDFIPGKDQLLPLDFTASNKALSADIVNDTARFCEYIDAQLSITGSLYGIGGYNEHRTIYDRSALFGDENTASLRRLHLGTDIWGKAGTPIYTFMDSTVFSVAMNEGFGDYGATIILQHAANGWVFYTLYGHLALKDIQQLQPGQLIPRGSLLAHFGEPVENGHWPPHLHFQVIEDIGEYKGDYPGVCNYGQRDQWLANCPDPDLILQLNQYLL